MFSVFTLEASQVEILVTKNDRTVIITDESCAVPCLQHRAQRRPAEAYMTSFLNGSEKPPNKRARIRRFIFGHQSGNLLRTSARNRMDT